MADNHQGFTRRQFAKTAGAVALAGAAGLAPRAASANKIGDKPLVIGEGEHQYAVDHNWAKLPDQYTWQTTHNVAVGTDGTVYVIHEGRLDQTDHPSIFAFDPEGNFLRAFGEQFQGGGHGVEVRSESGEDVLYVCSYQQQRSIAKLTAGGEQIWRKGAPMETGFYAKGEDQYPRERNDNPWGRDRFMPTNIAFHPESGFFVADGYGAWRIHYYDADGNWVRSFGEPGDKEKVDGTFRLPHGIWIDDRSGEPLLAIADRSNGRMQWTTLEGEHVRTDDNFSLPANIDIYGDVMLVPDLAAQVKLLGKDNQVVAVLGDDADRITADNKKHGGFHIRTDESLWLPGKFVHPHDACFDADGNIYVVEWVKTGRVTKLTRIA